MYVSMFEDNEQDDKEIVLKEPGEDSRESPHIEKEDEHIGITLKLPNRSIFLLQIFSSSHVCFLYCLPLFKLKYLLTFSMSDTFPILF